MDQQTKKLPSIRYERLNLTSLDAKFGLLTTSKFRCCLKNQDPYGISNTTIVAVGAIENGNPIGLSLVSVHKELNYAILHSFVLEWDRWSLEIADQLLETTEQEVKTEEGSVIKYLYPDGDPWTPIIDELLAKRNWSDPELQVIKYYFDSRIFHPPWLNRPPKLPKNFKIFPWKTLSKKKLDEVKIKQRQGRFEASVSPFGPDEALIESINSLGIKYKNEVVGWMITHRVAPDMIRYSQFFIDPEHQFLGFSARLLIDAIQLQKRSSVRWALFEINLDQVEPSWLKFVEKRLEPYAHAKIEVYKSWKEL